MTRSDNPFERPPAGWSIADAGQARTLAAALGSGEAINLRVEAGPVPAWLTSIGGVELNGGGVRTILVSDRRDARADLVCRPKTIALGIGCEHLAPAESILALAERCLSEAAMAPQSVACIATLALKAGEPAIQALARHLNVPICAFEADQLEAETPRLLNPSDVVFRVTGCHGVAEGAALASVGQDGDLILPKRIGDRSTCAIARSQGLIDPVAISRRQGYDDALTTVAYVAQAVDETEG